MADVAVSNTFVAGTTALAPEVNTNFSDLVLYINARNSATATWDNMNVTATVAVPVTIKSNQSTTEVAIDNTATDGDPILTFKLSGTTLFAIGVDDGDGDKLKLGTTAIGTNQLLGISTLTVGFLNGTEADPAISFHGDTDNGLYHTGSANTWRIVAAAGSLVTFSAGQTQFLTHVIPSGGGSLNFGNASDYWADISYKTLTDRGCLPFCDDGVELPDGRIVTDLEALAEIKKHPTKKTIQGLPMLDYKTFPKKAYTPAEKGGVLLPRDAQTDEPIGGSDGVEMTMMFGVMIGALKEINDRLKVLEAA